MQLGTTKSTSFTTTARHFYGMGQLGAQQQAFAQAQADAEREAARMEAYEPYERLGYLGTGITGMLGGYPGQYQSTVQPNPTPLQTALGIGTGLAGMYGAYKDMTT